MCQQGLPHNQLHLYVTFPAENIRRAKAMKTAVTQAVSTEIPVMKKMMLKMLTGNDQILFYPLDRCEAARSQ